MFMGLIAAAIARRAGDVSADPDVSRWIRKPARQPQSV
jgi:hypothetical protein